VHLQTFIMYFDVDLCLYEYRCFFPHQARISLKCKNVNTPAQQKVITGVVKDNDGEIVPGANVVVKGSTNGTITDLNGKFSIHANSKDVLVISFIGYKTLELTVGNQSALDIVLTSESEALQEVVVTALGIKREKKALGYAMQEIKTTGFIENRSESVSNMLQGKVAGVQISQSATGVGGSTRVCTSWYNFFKW
jgi:hypothetical protein